MSNEVHTGNTEKCAESVSDASGPDDYQVNDRTVEMAGGRTHSQFSFWLHGGVEIVGAAALVVNAILIHYLFNHQTDFLDAILHDIQQVFVEKTWGSWVRTQAQLPIRFFRLMRVSTRSTDQENVFTVVSVAVCSGLFYLVHFMIFSIASRRISGIGGDASSPPVIFRSLPLTGTLFAVLGGAVFLFRQHLPEVVHDRANVFAAIHWIVATFRDDFRWVLSGMKYFTHTEVDVAAIGSVRYLMVLWPLVLAFLDSVMTDLMHRHAAWILLYPVFLMLFAGFLVAFGIFAIGSVVAESKDDFLSWEARSVALVVVTLAVFVVPHLSRRYRLACIKS